jgi:hypothetical protein
MRAPFERPRIEEIRQAVNLSHESDGVQVFFQITQDEGKHRQKNEIRGRVKGLNPGWQYREGMKADIQNDARAKESVENSRKKAGIPDD